MLFSRAKSGFSIIELIIILVVVGLLSFVGYTAYQKLYPSTANTADARTQTRVATDVKPIPTITSSSDLTTAETTLDQTDTSSSSDLTALDSQLSF